MNIPVIFVHTNDAFYLDFTLNQVHNTNPKNPIYLIGSNVTPRYDFVNYIDIETYSYEAEKFKTIYKHMSGNSYEFELFCFQRWFITNEFCAKNEIDSFLYLDSDALIYFKIDEYFKKLGKYSFTISNKISPHCTFFTSLQSLKDLCKFIEKLYLDPAYTDRFINKYNHHVKNSIAGGVCDMTAFGEYCKDHPGCAKELTEIENGQVFDDNVNSSDGFEMENGYKKIQMTQDEPFGKLITGEMIKFNLLHFQGNAKRILPDYYTGKNLNNIKRKLKLESYLKKHSFFNRLASKAGYKFIS